MNKKITFSIITFIATAIYASEQNTNEKTDPICQDTRFSDIISAAKTVTKARETLYKEKESLNALNIFENTLFIEKSLANIHTTTESLNLSYPSQKSEIISKIQALVPSYPCPTFVIEQTEYIRNKLTNISELLKLIFQRYDYQSNFFKNIIQAQDSELFDTAEKSFDELKKSYNTQQAITSLYNDIVKGDTNNYAKITAILTAFQPSSTIAEPNNIPDDTIHLSTLNPYQKDVVGLLQLMKTYAIGQSKLPEELSKNPQEIWASDVIKTVANTSSKISQAYSTLYPQLPSPKYRLALNILLFEALPSFTKRIDLLDTAIQTNINQNQGICSIQ